MRFIDIDLLNERLPHLKNEFHSKEPFKYVIFEDFFPSEVALEILNEYPKIDKGTWDGTTYLDQKNKFQKNTFDEHSAVSQLFNELNSTEFLRWLEGVTEIESKLIGDKDLFGGGLHQSTNGAFLNVHVDYNIHPKTKYHRRLNVLVYMNQDWKDNYNGHLELWDLTNGNKKLLERVSPKFNRCVIFETNEISFHGHPSPLNTPAEICRKSIATYYYTKTRPNKEVAEEHNTIYVNTEGAKGKLKRFNSGVKAALERINRTK